ncbi:MAG: hybrid sensor histidine kinase/response regulator, partial [Rubrivivax sp.]|nr:hybrid sensor histidine kinase/response regulator [Rubrivivax sp.]
LSSAFDAILDYSQLESGQVRVDLQPCRLRDILVGLERRFAPLAQQRALALEVLLPPPQCVVRSDRELLTRVLSNLLANAVKFTRPPPDLRLGGFDVRLRVRVRGLLATVYVMDRGPGIAEADRARIFDAGVQVGNAERDRRQGHGLGLATVRSICQRALPDHGLRLRSVVGHGSHFMLDIPLELGTQLPDEDPFPISVIDIRRRVLDGAMVLVVEDDAGLRAGLAEVLRSAGAFVAEAGTLAQALQWLASADRRPDLLLTDWRLPQQADGRQVVAEVRRLCGGRELPAFVLTADQLAAEDALRGVPLAEVIRKPVGRKALLTRLAAHYRAPRSPLEGGP